jgi:polyisoprenoid-binding protein YceI
MYEHGPIAWRGGFRRFTKVKGWIALSTFSMLVVSVAGAGSPIEFKVGAGRASQQIAQVESVTDFETFTARTDKVSGSITFDPATRSGGGRIVVSAATLDTGIPTRNDHMRGPGWLDTERFPEIVFESSRVEHVRGDEYRAAGKLTLHGVTKTITLPVTVKLLRESEATRRAGFRGDVLQVRTKFDVKLADYGIRIVGAATGKVAETVTISVTVYGQSG